MIVEILFKYSIHLTSANCVRASYTLIINQVKIQGVNEEIVQMLLQQE